MHFGIVRLKISRCVYTLPRAQNSTANKLHFADKVLGWTSDRDTEMEIVTAVKLDILELNY